MKKCSWWKIGFVMFLFVGLNPAHAEEKKTIDVSKHIKKCKACHGKDLKGKKKTPGIYGEPFSVLYTSLTSDVPKKMEKIVKKFSKDEAMAIASYIAHFDEEPDDESERD
jgi:cytochrome c553